MSYPVSRKRKASVCHEHSSAAPKRSRTEDVDPAMPIGELQHTRPLHHTHCVPAPRQSGIYNPQQLLEKTFSFLPGRDLHRTQLACRDFHHIISSSTPLRARLRPSVAIQYPDHAPSPTMTTSAAVSLGYLSDPQSSSSSGSRSMTAPSFIHISPTGHHGSLDFTRAPPASVWREIAPFPRPVFEVVLRIPGRFRAQPTVKAADGGGGRGLTLGMIADAFLQHAPWGFWQERGRAEFFALQSPPPPPQRPVVDHVSFPSTTTVAMVLSPPCREARGRGVATSCAQDVMDFELQRGGGGGAMEFSPGRMFASEMMCLN